MQTMYTYSKHILQRILERDISIEDIEAIVSGQVNTIQFNSNRDENVCLILGFIGTRGLVVVLNHVTNVLITVRPMRDNEKQLFMEVYDDNEIQ